MDFTLTDELKSRDGIIHYWQYTGNGWHLSQAFGAKATRWKDVVALLVNVYDGGVWVNTSREQIVIAK